MNDDNELLISIGADLSAYNSALQTAKKNFDFVKNSVTTDKITMGLDYRAFASSISEAKQVYDRFKQSLMDRGNPALTGLDIDDKALMMAAEKFIDTLDKMEKAAVTSSKRISEVRRARLTQESQDAVKEAKRLQDELVAIEERGIKERTLKMKQLFLTRQEDRKEYAKAYDEAKKYNDKLIADAKTKQEAEAKEYAKAYDEAKKYNDKLIADAKAKEQKIAAYRIKQSIETQKQIDSDRRKELADLKKHIQAKYALEDGDGDTTLHRNFIDSAKVVAKYGIISQALYGMQNAMLSVVKETARFNQSIADATAILGYTKEQATQLALDIDKVSVAYGQSADAVAKATLALGRAGVDDINSLTKAMELLTAMSIVTGDTIEDGASAMSSLIAVYGGEGINAMDKYTSKTEELGNNMAAVANATRLGIADFSTISNYALTSAKAAGLTSEAFFALSGAFSKVGLNASTIGTSVRRIGKLVTDSSKDITEFFISLNMSQATFAKDMRTNSLKAITDLSKRMSELSPDALNAAMPNEVQLRSTLNSLLEIYDTDGIQKMQEEMKTYNSVTDEAQKSVIGLNRALKSVGNAISQAFNQQANSLFNMIFGDMTGEEFANVANSIGSALRFVTNLALSAGVAFAALSIKLKYTAASAKVAAGGMTLFGRSIAFANTMMTKGNLVIGLASIAFATYMEYTSGAEENTTKLNESIELTTENLKKMKDNQLQVAKSNLLEAQAEKTKVLADLEERLVEAQKKKSQWMQAEDTTKLKAKIEGEKTVLDTIKEQLIRVDSFIDGTAQANIKVRETAEQSRELANALKVASDNAITLSINLNNALTSFKSTLREYQTLKGGLTDLEASMANIKDKSEAANKSEKQYADELTEKRKVYNEYVRANTTEVKEAKELASEITEIETKYIKVREDIVSLQNQEIKLKKDSYAQTINDATEVALQREKTKIALDATLNTEAKARAERKASYESEIARYDALYANTEKLDERRDIARQKEVATLKYQQEAAEAQAKAQEKAGKAGERASKKAESDAKKATAEAERAKRLADRIAKDTQQANEEIAKQDVLRFQIGEEKSLRIFKVESKSLETARKKYKEAKALVVTNEKLLSGSKTIKQLEEDKTNLLKAELALLEQMTAEMSKWENAFTGLFSGDLAGAINSAFGENIQGIQKAVAGLAGGADSILGSIAGGFTGAAIQFGMEALGALFGGDKEQTPPVLDDMAKTSESMANSLNYIKNAQNPLLSLTREMTGYLNTISKSFGGVENSLLRSGIDLSGSTFKGSAKAGFLGLTSKSTELFGTSIQVASSSLSNMMSGWVDATLLTTTKTVKKGVFKSSTTYNTTGQDISGQLSQYLAEATQAVFNSLTLSGEALGISTAGLANQSINLGTFDTTGMSADEVAAELEGRFSAQIDAIAESYFGAVREFQVAGEGLAETLYRVTVNFEQVGHSMKLIGKSVNWRTANIIADTAGGIDALNSSLASYTENFFSEQEQYQMHLTTMKESFTSLGLALPASNEAFRTLVRGINTTTDDGAKLFAEVISLSDGFSQLTEMMKDFVTTLNDVALYIDYLNGLQDFTKRKMAVSGASDVDMARYAITASQDMLKAIELQTELSGITVDNYLQQLELAHMNNTLTADQLANWQSLGDALLNVEEATKAYNDILITQGTDAIKAVADAWLSNLSYLTLAQRAEFASGYLAIASKSNGVIDTVEAARLAAETALASTSTREEYVPIFDRYMNELKNDIPDATLDDVVSKLDTLIEVTKKLEETTRQVA